MRYRHTKIVCTIGPATETREKLRILAQAGMDVARLNFSHGTHDWHGERIRLIREVEQELGRPIAVLMDLCGPKLRVGELPPEGVELRQGEHCFLTTAQFTPGPASPRIPVPLLGLIAALKPGGLVYLDDAQIELEVEEAAAAQQQEQDVAAAETAVAAPVVRCRVRHGGVLFSRKGITAPGADFQISALTPKDLEDAQFGVRQSVNYIGVSFVRRAADMDPVRQIINRENAGAQIVAKIEKPEAIQNLDEIVMSADAVMVARGDLGVETPLHQVPILQKQIISRCNREGKPVITATQMMESMIRAPRPTRAEVSDVANAVFDGTSAVMLSGETALGQFPLETVTAMAATAEHAEAHLPYEELLREALRVKAASPTAAIAQGVAEIAYDLDAAAILCWTASGATALCFAQLRLRLLIIAATEREDTYQRLALAWGVRPLLLPPPPQQQQGNGTAAVAANMDDRVAATIVGALRSGWVQPGQTVVVAVGQEATGSAAASALTPAGNGSAVISNAFSFRVETIGESVLLDP